MNDPRPVKMPGPDHPIAITPTTTRVQVTLAGQTIADSRAALTLRESTYDPVQYIPRADVDMQQLRRSDHVTYCPYKGECTYYHVAIGSEEVQNAAWSYEEPHTAMEQIRRHLAFYPERVDAIHVGDD